MKAPNRLDFTPEEIDALLIRLDGECLQKRDYSLLADILKAMVWLSLSLQEKELSIMRLRKIFGIKTESAKKLLALAHGKSPSYGENGEGHSKKTNKTKEEKQEKKKPKNHGHRPSTDYSQAKVIEVANQTLKKGINAPTV